MKDKPGYYDVIKRRSTHEDLYHTIYTAAVKKSPRWYKSSEQKGTRRAFLGTAVKEMTILEEVIA